MRVYSQAEIAAAEKDFYVYTATFTPITHGQTQTQVIKTDIDSIFHLQILNQIGILGSADAATGNNESLLMGQQYPGITCTIFDDSNGAYLTSGAVPLVNLFGNAQYPSIVPGMYTIGRAATITCTVTNNYTSAALGALTLAFIGRKVFI
jgi:hypothetical protein